MKARRPSLRECGQACLCTVRRFLTARVRASHFFEVQVQIFALSASAKWIFSILNRPNNQSDESGNERIFGLGRASCNEINQTKTKQCAVSLEVSIPSLPSLEVSIPSLPRVNQETCYLKTLSRHQLYEKYC